MTMTINIILGVILIALCVWHTQRLCVWFMLPTTTQEKFDKEIDKLIDSVDDSTDKVIEEVKEIVEEVKEDVKELKADLAEAGQMTKAQLEEYARKFGVELDRRMTKANMLNEFKKHLKK